MDNSKATRFICEECRAELPDRESLSEHRTSCGGERPQLSTPQPEPPRHAPAEDKSPKNDHTLSPRVRSVLADADAATRRKRRAYEWAVSSAKEAGQHAESLNRIIQQKDSLYAALTEARGRLRSAVESKASKSDRFIYETRMNHASKAMDLLSGREREVTAAMEEAIVNQAAAMEKVLEAMSVERSIFKLAVSLLSEDAELSSAEQTGR